MSILQNTTMSPPPLSSGFSLPRLINTITSDARYSQLAYHIFLYVPLMVLFVPRYLDPIKGPRRARTISHRWSPLVFHILVSLAIAARFQYRILTMPAHLYPHAGPVATKLDLAMGLTNAAVGWGLARKNGKGNPRVARLGFHSFSLHVALCSVMGYVTQSPGWLDAMVKDHNAFAHVRWILVVDRMVGIFSNYGEGYTVGLFTGLLMSTAEGKSPPGFGMPFYLLGMLVLLVVEKWISGMITPKNAKTNPFLRLCLFIGLVDYSTYTMLSSADADDAMKEKQNGGVKAD